MKGTQKLLAQIVGVVLTLVGVAGFFMGDSLLGFGINTLHNVVHLVTGLLGLWVGFFSSEDDYAVNYNKWLGLVYVLVGVVGFFGVLSFLNVNAADNYLHLVLGVVLAGVGFFVKE